MFYRHYAVKQFLGNIGSALEVDVGVVLACHSLLSHFADAAVAAHCFPEVEEHYLVVGSHHLLVGHQFLHSLHGLYLPAHALVACQGAEGSYQQQACEKLFEYPDILYFDSFDKVFSAVEGFSYSNDPAWLEKYMRLNK